MLRFYWNKNGMKDLALPILAYWYFSYRVVNAAKYAGYGNFTKEELIDNAKKDLKALNFLIGKNKFLFSDERPCVADCAVFGLTAQIKYNDTGLLNHFMQSLFQVFFY